MSLNSKIKWLEAYHCKVYWDLETGGVFIEPGSHIHEFTREPEPWENSDDLEIRKIWPKDLGPDKYKALMSCQHNYQKENQNEDVGKPLGCKIDADYCGDVLCQHLKEPCDWWLQRMTCEKYKDYQAEHYKLVLKSDKPVSAYWYEGITLSKLKEMGKRPENRDWDGVYDILVNHCGASEHMRGHFVLMNGNFVKYCFQGILGSSGKIWNRAGKIYIACDPEDKTMDLEMLINRVNRKLAELE